MTNPDSLDIYETHEGLRAISPAKVLKIAQANEQLRVALKIASDELARYVDLQRILDYIEYAAETQKKLDAINAVLSGEGSQPVEPTPERELPGEITTAVMDLSQAMGNPCVDWTDCEFMATAVIDEAARRLSEKSTGGGRHEMARSLR